MQLHCEVNAAVISEVLLCPKNTLFLVIIFKLEMLIKHVLLAQTLNSSVYITVIILVGCSMTYLELARE